MGEVRGRVVGAFCEVFGSSVAAGRGTP
jgi:hypothetical protein